MKKINPNILNENIPDNQMLSHYTTAFSKTMPLITNIIKQKQVELKSKFSMNNLFKGNEIKDLVDLQIEQLKP